GKAGDLAPQLDLGGQATGVLEDLEGHPQLGRDGLVLLEAEAPALQRQVVEEAPVDGLADALLGDPGDGVHSQFRGLLPSRPDATPSALRATPLSLAPT